MKTAKKQAFLDMKSAVAWARRLKMQRSLVVVMPLCSPVFLSYLDAAFEPCCGCKDFWTACCCCLLLLLAAATCWCCLLLAKMCCSLLDPKRGVKLRQGKLSSVIKTRTRTELGPSLA